MRGQWQARTLTGTKNNDGPAEYVYPFLAPSRYAISLFLIARTFISLFFVVLSPPHFLKSGVQPIYIHSTAKSYIFHITFCVIFFTIVFSRVFIFCLGRARFKMFPYHVFFKVLNYKF